LQYYLLQRRHQYRNIAITRRLKNTPKNKSLISDTVRLQPFRNSFDLFKMSTSSLRAKNLKWTA
uniref:Ovule protein n=1 Tax=Gongylonema pulchrum TaxID=637853 RepID=A0A183DFH0_9BILA